jgi:peptidyl-dipeptidase Dcp
MTNPLLAPWDTPFALPPFASIRDEDFAPAFEEGLAQARAAVAAIAANPDAPSYANTIEALELSEETLDRVAGVFFNIAGSDSNPAREALQRDLAPKLSAFSSEITNNRALFQRIDTLWQARDTLGLTAEQDRVLMLYRRMFVRAGARWMGAGRADDGGEVAPGRAGHAIHAEPAGR